MDDGGSAGSAWVAAASAWAPESRRDLVEDVAVCSPAEARVPSLATGDAPAGMGRGVTRRSVASGTPERAPAQGGAGGAPLELPG